MIRIEEEDEVGRKREAAARLARQRGLSPGQRAERSIPEIKHESSAVEDIRPPSEIVEHSEANEDPVEAVTHALPTETLAENPPEREFVPARLPFFS